MKVAILIGALVLAGCSSSASTFASGAPLSAVLSWTPSTTRTDGTPVVPPVSFTVYQGTSGAEVVMASYILGSTFTATTGLAPGTTVCWQVTETETSTGLESARTPEACKTFPAVATPPNPPIPLTAK